MAAETRGPITECGSIEFNETGGGGFLPASRWSAPQGAQYSQRLAHQPVATACAEFDSALGEWVAARGNLGYDAGPCRPPLQAYLFAVRRTTLSQASE